MMAFIYLSIILSLSGGLDWAGAQPGLSQTGGGALPVVELPEALQATPCEAQLSDSLQGRLIEMYQVVRGKNLNSTPTQRQVRTLAQTLLWDRWAPEMVLILAEALTLETIRSSESMTGEKIDFDATRTQEYGAVLAQDIYTLIQSGASGEAVAERFSFLMRKDFALHYNQILPMLQSIPLGSFQRWLSETSVVAALFEFSRIKNSYEISKQSPSVALKFPNYHSRLIGGHRGGWFGISFGGLTGIQVFGIGQIWVTFDPSFINHYQLYAMVIAPLISATVSYVGFSAYSGLHERKIGKKLSQLAQLVRSRISQQVHTFIGADQDAMKGTIRLEQDGRFIYEMEQLTRTSRIEAATLDLTQLNTVVLEIQRSEVALSKMATQIVDDQRTVVQRLKELIASVQTFRSQVINPRLRISQDHYNEAVGLIARLDNPRESFLRLFAMAKDLQTLTQQLMERIDQAHASKIQNGMDIWAALSLCQQQNDLIIEALTQNLLVIEVERTFLQELMEGRQQEAAVQSANLMLEHNISRNLVTLKQPDLVSSQVK